MKQGDNRRFSAIERNETGPRQNAAPVTHRHPNRKPNWRTRRNYEREQERASNDHTTGMQQQRTAQSIPLPIARSACQRPSTAADKVGAVQLSIDWSNDDTAHCCPGGWSEAAHSSVKTKSVRFQDSASSGAELMADGHPVSVSGVSKAFHSTHNQTRIRSGTANRTPISVETLRARNIEEPGRAYARSIYSKKIFWHRDRSPAVEGLFRA